MKVLILQNKLTHYRIPVYNLLNQQKGIEVTLAYPAPLSDDESINFHQIQLKTVKRGGFTLHEGLYEICCRFEIVIAMFDIKWLTHMKLGFKRGRTFKLIYWGIGVSTEKGFDVDRRFDRIRFLFAKRADGIIFYSKYPVGKYVKAGFRNEKLFVANNTIKSIQIPRKYSKRNSIIFVGAIERRKGLVELIDAYLRSYTSFNKSVKLVIIGEGSERISLEKYCSNLQSMPAREIEISGSITNQESLKKYFDRAIASVSPGQAGLSVLASFSFGVPFLCKDDAITGGERMNIKNGYNGYQYKEGSYELSKLLVNLVNDGEHSEAMGVNAFNYYWEERTVESMINGFKKAITYVSK